MNYHRSTTRDSRSLPRAGGTSRAERRFTIESLERRTLLSAAAEAAVQGHLHAVEELALPSPYLPNQRFLAKRGSYLSKAAEGDPADIAMDYLVGNAAYFGLQPADLTDSVITDRYTDSRTGVTHLYLRQMHNGLEVENANLNIHIDRNGRVISVGGAFLPGLGNQEREITRQLDAEDALIGLADRLGLHIEAAPLVLDAADTRPQGTLLRAPGASADDVPAELEYVLDSDGQLRLGWSLIVRPPTGGSWYNASVDAQTGEVLYVVDWTNDYSASYNVLPRPIESPQDGSRVTVLNPHDPVASPFGWHDTNGVDGAEFSDTRGNNVSAQDDTDANNSGGFRPSGVISGSSDLSFDFPLDLALTPVSYQSASITNLFYWNNMLHDVHYRYGFTEAAGNFQTSNYGKGGLGNDAVQADAQDGNGTNNANFSTPPDGSTPRMQMYNFTYTTPGRDGDLANEIITHEYGHGVSNRLTGGPSNANALNSTQSGGMGEGWSDFWAVMFTQKSTDTQMMAYPQGTYVLGQSPSGAGIRRKPYSFDMTIDPLTFDAYGTSGTGGGVTRSTQVHNTGEIWCSTLWDANWLLVNKYGFTPDIQNGYNPANPKGNTLMLQLVMDGLKLQPANPTFTQARDAVLQADQVLTGGANQRELWIAFARRGLGYSAYTGATASVTSITPAFDLPLSLLEPSVVSHSPQLSVGTPVIALNLVFSKAMDPASFSLADINSFTGPDNVDLLSDIIGHTWSNGNQTLTINFAGQSVDGVYSLNVGPNILAADNASPMNQDGDSNIGELVQDAYTAVFRFDALLGQVVSTSPANGSLAALPLSSVDFNFNEAFDPASLSASDLTVNQGSVTGVSVVDADTARFTLSGLSTEGTLSLTIAAGTILDAGGNPMGAYSGTLALDIGTVAFPTPLTSRGVSGTLIYEGSTSGSIGTTADTDSFTLLLDAGQVLTLRADPSVLLQPTIALFDSGDNLIASSASPAVGADALLQTIPIAVAGLYTFRVGSVDSATSGNFTLFATLNSALETEHYNGPTNDTRATAQPLGPAFIKPSADATADIASVLGKTPAPSGVTVYSDSFESGSLGPAWTTYSSLPGGQVQVTTAQGAATGSYALIMDTTAGGNTLNEAVWSVNLSSVLAPKLIFSTRNFSDELTTLPTTFTGHVNGDGVSISADGNTWWTVWSQNPPSTWTTVEIDLAAVATAAGITLGAGTKIKFQQYDNASISGGDGRGFDALSITTPASALDFYSMPLEAGQVVSLAGTLTGGTATAMSIQLLDSSGAVVATGTSSGAGSFNSVISGFTVLSTGTYYATITAANESDYALTVVRKGMLDLEPNSPSGSAQSAGNARMVVGSLRAGQGPGRLYVYDATANQIRELNPTTGAILRSFNSPVSPSSGPDIGLATTHSSLLVGGSNTQAIYELDLNTGATLRTISNPSIAISGMAFLNNEIYALTDTTAGRITVFNYATGAVARTITASVAVTETLGASASELFGRNSSSIYRINPLTGAATLWGSANAGEGLGVIGNELFTCDTTTVFVYDLQTKALKRSYSGLTNLEAIGADGGTAEDDDYYSVTLNAGEALLLQTSTPGGGPGEFVNTLDPAIQVYGPAGSVVASDDNSAADGRNASLSYIAPTTGVYRIRVHSSPSNSTAGEYALSISSSALVLTLPASVQENAGSAVGTLSVVPIPSTDLIVTLSPTDPARMTVPATITIPAGASSVPVPMMILNNTLLEGPVAVGFTASATGYGSDTATITIQDDETAVLTVSLPSTASEGAGTLSGTVFSSAAPAKDVTVLLTSSAPGQATVPVSVTLLAGQTSADFTLTIVNDTQIDGAQPVTISANVANWTGGSSIITIDDNDAFLAVVLPQSGWETQLGGLGTVQLGGTLASDLIVTLLSSDTSELTVPATVTVLAGQTSATFALTLPADALQDGQQVVEVTAAASGLTNGSDTIILRDADLHHFVFNPINGPKTAAVAFSASAVAYNIDGEVLSLYSQSVPLSATGQAGSLPSSPTHAVFGAGQWTGQVTINAVDPQAQLHLTDGTVTAGSQTFAVQPGMVSQFTWNPVGNPQIANIPFPTSITARDANGFIATGFNGTADLHGLVEAFGPVQNIFGNATHTSSAFGTYTVGYAFTASQTVQLTALRSYWGIKTSIWTDSGVLLASKTTGGTLGSWTSTSLDAPITLQAGQRYRIASYVTSGMYYWQTATPGFSWGAINGSYYSNSDSFPATTLTGGIELVDLEVRPLTTASVPVLPSAATFANGIWTGDVTVPQSAVSMRLLVDDGASHTGTSNPFTVIQRRLSLSIPQDVRENDGTINAILHISPSPAADLTVTLTNSKPSRLSVPATVVVPAGHTSVIVPIAILNNGVVDGTEIADLSATAPSYSTATGSIRVHDNESAVISVSLPATASESAGTIVGTISFSDPATNDIQVLLSAPSNSRMTIPNSVLMPAGQTSVNFNITLNNNTLIDGSAAVSIQAAVENWVNGFASVLIEDDDNVMSLSLPGGVHWEGQALAQQGTVSIGGTMAQDLLISLISSDPTALAVPPVIVIPAGMTSAGFTITLLGDDLRDGAQSVTISASAATATGGIGDAQASMTVHDADVDHFVFEPIASPQTAAVAFAIEIEAMNIDGQRILVFNDTATLLALGTGGAALPVTDGSVDFSDGIATQDVSIAAVDPSVRLRVEISSASGESNTFVLQAGALARFQWNPIGSPKVLNSPFNASITAVDANGFTVTDFSGPVNLRGWEGDIGGTQILSYVGYANTGANSLYRNTLQAIATHLPHYEETSISSTSAAALEAALVGKDVFLIPAQELGTSATFINLGNVWETVLQNFVSAGGVVIVCTYWNREAMILTNADLISIGTSSGSSSALVAKAADTALTTGVSFPFVSYNNNEFLPVTDGVISVATSSYAFPVVVSRDVGQGHVVVVGTDFGVLGTGMDRIIANAVQWAEGSATPVPINAGVSANFVNGVWNGSISVLQAKANIYLTADNGAGLVGVSTVFDVVPAAPQAPNLTVSTDTGISNSDNLTNRNNTPSTRLQFTIPGTIGGALVTLYADGVAVGSNMATGLTTTVTTDGLTLLGDGPVSFTARQILDGMESVVSAALVVTIDTQAPTVPGAPQLQAGSDSGVSSSDRITTITTPVLDVVAAPYYRVYQGLQQISPAYSTGATFTPAALADGVHRFTVAAIDDAGNLSGQSAELELTIDTTAPALVGGMPQFRYLAGPQAIEYQFTEPVSGIVDSLFSINNVADASAIPFALNVSGSSTLASLGWTGILPDGNYSTALAEGMTDLAGNPMSPGTFDFFVLAGDANRDRQVNLQDLAILANHWQQTGVDFARGDFDYNGVVDANDLGILSRNWQVVIVPPVSTTPAIPLNAVRRATRTPTRIIDEVMGTPA